MYSKSFVSVLFGALALCVLMLTINFFVMGRMAYELHYAYTHYHIDYPVKK